MFHSWVRPAHLKASYSIHRLGSKPACRCCYLLERRIAGSRCRLPGLCDIGSLPYLILSDEIIAMARRVMRGIPISTETIMLDLIEKVGPGCLYLTEGRSATLCRSEAWVPTILDRSAYALWTRPGASRPNNWYWKNWLRFSSPTRQPPCQWKFQNKLRQSCARLKSGNGRPIRNY